MVKPENFLVLPLNKRIQRGIYRDVTFSQITTDMMHKSVATPPFAKAGNIEPTFIGMIYDALILLAQDNKSMGEYQRVKQVGWEGSVNVVLHMANASFEFAINQSGTEESYVIK